jgi:hypothetical protein
MRDDSDIAAGNACACFKLPKDPMPNICAAAYNAAVAQSNMYK